MPMTPMLMMAVSRVRARTVTKAAVAASRARIISVMLAWLDQSMGRSLRPVGLVEHESKDYDGGDQHHAGLAGERAALDEAGGGAGQVVYCVNGLVEDVDAGQVGRRGGQEAAEPGCGRQR